MTAVGLPVWCSGRFFLASLLYCRHDHNVVEQLSSAPPVPVWKWTGISSVIHVTTEWRNINS